MQETRESLKLADWRKEFPPEGPSPDAPRQDVERYLLLRYAALVARSDRLIDYALEGVPSCDGDLDGPRRAPTDGDLCRLKRQGDSTFSQFLTLKKWADVAGIDRRARKAIYDADLDDLAHEVCRRYGLVMWQQKRKRRRKARTVGAEGPTLDTPMAIKMAYFQQQYGRLNGQTDELARVDGAARRGKRWRQLLAVADTAVKHKRAILEERARLTGTALGRDDEKRERMIDLLIGEIEWRQRMLGERRPKQIGVNILKHYITAIKKARQGCYWSYRWLNGFDQSSTGAERAPLERAPCHVRIIRARLADLICKECGRFHLGDTTPVYDPVREMRWVRPVTCCWCKTENCAGPSNHRIAAFREAGKTTEMEHVIPFRIGLAMHRAYVPSMMLVGSTIKKATDRKALIAKVMRMPAHRLCFPGAVPMPKQPAECLRLDGIEQPVLTVYGIESVPPGEHCDLIECDDVVHAGNVFIAPARGQIVQVKLDDVLDYSRKPWTVFDWDTTVWRIDDPDHRLETWAKEHPEEWVNLHLAMGGPEPQLDEKGKVVKPAWYSWWLKRFPPEKLRLMHEKNSFSYQRAMMLVRVSDEDACFKRVDLYVTDVDPLRARCPAGFLETCNTVTMADLNSSPHVLAVDLAFTGMEQGFKKGGRLKGRSKTAFLGGCMEPKTKTTYFRHVSSEYLAPSEHERHIERRAKAFHNADVAIEVDKTVSELSDRLERHGFTVSTYNPQRLGGKGMRKYELAAAFNEGRALLPGRLRLASSGNPKDPASWRVVPEDGFAKFRTDLLLFPLKITDEIDGAEILVRTLERDYGGDPEPGERKKGEPEIPAHVAEFNKWRDAYYKAKPERDSDEDAVRELSEGLEGELVTAGVLGGEEYGDLFSS